MAGRSRPDLIEGLVEIVDTPFIDDIAAAAENYGLGSDADASTLDQNVVDIAGYMALEAIVAAVDADRLGTLAAIGVDVPEDDALWRETVVELI